jgi:hypothetical protein
MEFLTDAQVAVEEEESFQIRPRRHLVETPIPGGRRRRTRTYSGIGEVITTGSG